MTETKTTLKSWNDDEKPREKILQHGAKSLSINELLAIILRSGIRGETAIDLARHIFADYENDLNKLSQASVHELMNRYKGVGLAKAGAIAAAVELSGRRLATPNQLPRKITSSDDAFKHMAPLLCHLDHEEFWALFLNQANHILGMECISSGGMAATITDVRMLFRKAIQIKATAIIVAHNHPSGQLKASPEDCKITQQIKDGGLLLDIKLLDHLIIGHDSFLSFADEGMII